LGLWKIPADVVLPDINFKGIIDESEKVSKQKQDIILDFMSITQASKEEAAAYLMITDNNLNLAVASYLETKTSV